MIAIYLVTILVIIISFLHFYGSFLEPVRQNLAKFRVPGRAFFFGHAFLIKDTTKFLKVCGEFQDKYGDNVLLEVGPFDNLLVTRDHKMCELIMTSSNNLTKTKVYNHLRPWLGRGLLISNGPHWKKHRKILNPAFHSDILKQFIHVYDSVGDVLIQKLINLGGDCKSVEISRIMSLCALDVISETAMGTHMNAQMNQTSDYVQSVQAMCKIIVNRTTEPLKIPDFTFMFSRDFFKQKKHLAILHKYSSNMIRNRRIQKENEPENDGEEFGAKGRMVFIDLLLKFSRESDNSLSDLDIREEVDTFMFAGHDTTAACFSFTLYCLANNPEAQTKAYKEQKDLFGDEKSPSISHQELQEMKYLELVIKESLRLYPPVPIIGRKITEPIQYDDDLTLTSGTDVGILIYGIHRDPKLFPEPEKFNPDRYNEANAKTTLAFVPFSAGPRNCIGQKFAMLELKTVLSKILRNFELLPAVPQHDVIIASEIVLKSLNGVKIGLKPRLYS